MLKLYFRMSRVTENTQQVLIMLVKQRKSQKEVSEELGMTKQRVWNILAAYKKFVEEQKRLVE